MEPILTSTAVVALAEIGDKTMLLAIVLAARFRKPVPIILGILVATLANHGIAAFLGHAIAGLLDGTWFRYAVGLGFVAMAWTLVPDTFDDDDEPKTGRFGAFLATTIAFFLVEIGDKTQIATIALGAQFGNVLLVRNYDRRNSFLLPQPLKNIHYLDTRSTVQVSRRLVCHQNRRIIHQRTSNRYSLLLSSG